MAEALPSGAPGAPVVAVAGLLLVAMSLVTVRYLPFPLPNTQLLAPSTQPLPLPDKPSIVVLPFDNMSNDPEQDYFSNGITEDSPLISPDLQSLRHRPQHGVHLQRQSNEGARRRERLGVRYVLEGSVQKADRSGANHRAIDRRDHRRAPLVRALRPSLKDIFALQDEIVQKIVTTLNCSSRCRSKGTSCANAQTTWRPTIPSCAGWSTFTASPKRPIPRRSSCLREPLPGPAVCGGVRVARVDLPPGVGLALECRSADPGADV